MKSNSNSHKQELRWGLQTRVWAMADPPCFSETQELLEMAKNKIRRLENVTEHQISHVQAAENEVGICSFLYPKQY